MTESLDPDSADLLERLDAMDIPPAHQLSVDGARRAGEELFGGSEPPPFDGSIQEVSIDGPNGAFALRVYSPDTDGDVPVVVYLHGGGWVRGTLDTHDGVCRRLATDTSALVVSVDYHRAPEHPFPAPLEDAFRAVEWARINAATFDADGDRIAVAGDSAGGNLAAATALLARDRDGPTLRHQVLLYPVTVHAFGSDSYAEHGDDGLLTEASMRWYWEHYLASAVDGRHPYASPLLAKDLSGLPDATLVTAGFDPLRSEGLQYANRLEGAGVDVTRLDFEGTVHGFMLFPELARTDEAFERVSEELRRGLRP